MTKKLFILLFLTLAAYGQQEQKRVAILNTEGEGDLIYLSVRLREIAVKVLPKDKYSIMTAESIIDKMGSRENALKICREAQCLAEIGRKVSAAYVGQARVGSFGGNYTIFMELYNAGSGTLVDSFTGEAKDLSGLLKVINEKAPQMFRKMPGVSGGRIIDPGIENLSKSEDYELNEEKRYLVNLSTEPPGAVLNFDGEPIASCKETPCKAELREGNVRIIAALEQYEKADTTVSVKQNNQSIRIRMKANFGVLEIKPAYWDDIGSDERWSLTINGKAAYSFENRLSPGKYEVELSNRCYEVIKFEAGINKDKPEFFDMASYIKEFVKKGGLVLSAEADGEPVAEPVFVNGKKVGETPFSGTVPVCSRVEIGAGREVVNVEIKHNAENKYKHTMNTEERKRRVKQAEELRLAEEQRMELEKERQIEWEEKQNAWHLFFLGGLGWATMLNSIDALYGKDGSNFSLGLGFFKQRTNFFHLGLNLDFGGLGVGKMKNELKKMYPDLDSIGTISLFAKMGAFARWYPTNFAYLSVGVYKGKYDGNYGTFDNGEVFYFRGINAIVFPVGGGLVWCGPSYNAVLQTDDVTGLYFETLYNIVGGHGGYWSFVFGINIDILSKKPSSRK